MKTLYTSFILLLITLTFPANIISAQEKENKITATFKEVTEDEYFKFIDDKEVIYLFFDLDDSINFALYEEENIGKKFTLTWVDKVIEVLDEEDKPTGKKLNVKSITSIKEEK